MPPFQYEPYHNPYVAPMTALIQAPGQIEAQKAVAIANAQAAAAQQRGQAWAGAAQNIGQTVAAIPAQMQQQKLDALKMQDIQGQIAERNARAAEMQRANAAITAGEHAIKASVDPTTGKVDHAKAADLWEQAGFPTQANAYRESVQKTQQTAQAIEEGQQKLDAGKRQMQQGYADHLAELGAAGLEKLNTADPLHARDYAMGLVANAASHGLVDPDAAKQMLAQTAQASPDQLAGIYQKLVDASLTVKERMVADALKKAETAKNTAEAAKLNAEAAAGPKPSAEQDKQRYLAIQQAISLKQPISPADQAFAASYEKEKTLGVDATAAAAGIRQANAIEAQTAQQGRAQNFQVQQEGRKELTEKVETPYQTAQASAQTLRDVVAAAKNGNKVAASLQSLETTMSAIRAQGLNRINSAEIGVTADAGNLWDRIVGKVGKLDAGQPVPADLQKDMQQFASILEKAAYKKYSEGFSSITKRYNLNDEKPLAGPTIYARDPQGVLHSAPYGKPIPKGWTEE